MIAPMDLPLEQAALEEFKKPQKQLVEEISSEERWKKTKEWIKSLYKEKGYKILGLDNDVDFNFNYSYLDEYKVPNINVITATEEYDYNSLSIPYMIGLDLPSDQRPSWFSSEQEINQIKNLFDNIGNYTLQEFKNEKSKFSPEGQRFTDLTLQSMLYWYTYNDDRNKIDSYSVEELFEVLQNAFELAPYVSEPEKLNEQFGIGNCADFAHFLTRMNNYRGCEFAVVNLGGPHMIYLDYDKNKGFIGVEGTGLPILYYTNTHNPETAFRLYQKSLGVISFINLVCQGKTLEYTLSPEGELVAEIFQHDPTLDSLISNMLYLEKPKRGLLFDVSMSNQHWSYKTQLGNFFWKVGEIWGDDLSALNKSPFILGGYEYKGNVVNGKIIIGQVDFNQDCKEASDVILCRELSITPRIRLTPRHSITPGGSLQWLNGGYLDNLECITSYNYNFGISDEIDLNNLTLQNYIAMQYTVMITQINPQKEDWVQNRYEFGQRWSFCKGLIINPDGFFNKAEYGGSISFAIGLKKINIGIEGLYSKSKIKPFKADEAGLEGDFSYTPFDWLTMYCNLGYSHIFLPKNSENNFSISTGVNIKLNH